MEKDETTDIFGVKLSKDLDVKIQQKYLPRLQIILNDIGAQINTQIKEYLRLNPNNRHQADQTVRQWGHYMNAIKTNINMEDIFQEIQYIIKVYLNFEEYHDIAYYAPVSLNLNDLNELFIMIKSEFELNHYTWRYFSFFKNDSYMYKLNILNKRIEFDIAESGYISSYLSISPDKIFNTFKERAKKSLDRYTFDDERNLSKQERGEFRRVNGEYPLIGWKRSELLKALKESELFEEKVETVTTYTGKIKYIYTYPKISKKSMSIRKLRPLPIFDRVSKVKLELIYRYVNNYKNINFPKLCSIYYIDTITMLRMLDKFDPNFMGGNYKNLNVDEICATFGTTKEMVKSMIEEIPNISQAIIYQPGGRYAQNIQKKYADVFKSFESTESEELNSLYNKYALNCQNPNISEKEIVFDAIELGLVEYISRNMTKEEICKIIKNYIKNISK